MQDFSTLAVLIFWPDKFLVWELNYFVVCTELFMAVSLASIYSKDVPIVITTKNVSKYCQISLGR